MRSLKLKCGHLATVILVVLNIACGGDDKGTQSQDAPQHALIGTWDCIERDGVPWGGPGQNKGTLTLRSDGTYTSIEVEVSGDTDREDGTFVYDAELITFTVDVVPPDAITWEYVIGGAELELSRHEEGHSAEIAKYVRR